MGVKGAITEQARSKKPPTAVLGCFFGIFLIVGLVAFVFLGIIPFMNVVRAEGWRETPCVILSSGVKDHRGDDSTTYSVEVAYRYEVDGRAYTSHRYHFMTGSSSGYEGKKAVVDRLPPGAKTVCYVDPANPAEAVLERGFTADLLLGLIPLVFVLVGAGGIFFTVRSAAKRKLALAEGLASGGAPAVREIPTGPATLRPKVSPLGKLAIAVGVAVFWNGIVSVFLVQMIGGWQRGHPDGCLTVFLIPFVLVGLGLLLWVGYQFLALFNPRPTLALSARAVPLGESFDVEWETSGNVARVRKFQVTLEGREEATYVRGTSTTTDKHTFATIVVAESSNGEDMRRGKAAAQVPAGSMHSWASSNNKIVWVLRLKGEIPVWPDVNEEFPLEVLPRP